MSGCDGCWACGQILHFPRDRSHRDRDVTMSRLLSANLNILNLHQIWVIVMVVELVGRYYISLEMTQGTNQAPTLDTAKEEIEAKMLAERSCPGQWGNESYHHHQPIGSVNDLLLNTETKLDNQFLKNKLFLTLPPPTSESKNHQPLGWVNHGNLLLKTDLSQQILLVRQIWSIESADGRAFGSSSLLVTYVAASE